MSSIESKKAFLKGSINPSLYKQLSELKCCDCGQIGNYGLDLTIQGDYVLGCLNCSTVVTYHTSSKKDIFSLDEVIKSFIEKIKDHNITSKCKAPQCQEGPCSCNPSLQQRLRDSLNGRACFEKLSHL